uniref:Uncharacterized protein n=1 Tax=Megaviridae environmental sample TaxID=1737588 RepID=A0A5J6VK82_9VIRU|nr:MAG: hypothetical protein [Megaviridae environmental sample]
MANNATVLHALEFFENSTDPNVNNLDVSTFINSLQFELTISNDSGNVSLTDAQLHSTILLDTNTLYTFASTPAINSFIINGDTINLTNGAYEYTFTTSSMNNCTINGFNFNILASDDETDMQDHNPHSFVPEITFELNNNTGVIQNNDTLAIQSQDNKFYLGGACPSNSNFTVRVEFPSTSTTFDTHITNTSWYAITDENNGMVDMLDANVTSIVFLMIM